MLRLKQMAAHNILLWLQEQGIAHENAAALHSLNETARLQRWRVPNVIPHPLWHETAWLAIQGGTEFLIPAPRKYQWNHYAFSLCGRFFFWNIPCHPMKASIELKLLYTCLEPLFLYLHCNNWLLQSIIFYNSFCEQNNRSEVIFYSWYLVRDQFT